MVNLQKVNWPKSQPKLKITKMLWLVFLASWLLGQLSFWRLTISPSIGFYVPPLFTDESFPIFTWTAWCRESAWRRSRRSGHTCWSASSSPPPWCCSSDPRGIAYKIGQTSQKCLPVTWKKNNLWHLILYIQFSMCWSVCLEWVGGIYGVIWLWK